jgi:hypothetical protein
MASRLHSEVCEAPCTVIEEGLVGLIFPGSFWGEGTSNSSAVERVRASLCNEKIVVLPALEHLGSLGACRGGMWLRAVPDRAVLADALTSSKVNLALRDTP